MADDHGEAPQAEEAPPAEAKEELDEQPDTEGETAAEPAEGNAPAPAEGEDPAEGDAAAPADGDAAPAEGTEPRECFQPEARYAASPYLRLTRPLCHPPLDTCSH